MAISWKFSISEVGQSGNFSISAEVTDDTKVVDHQTETVSIQGRMDNQQQKEANFNALKQQYADKVAKVDVISALEAEAKAFVEKK